MRLNYTIRGLIVLTLLLAIVASAVQQRRRNARLREDILSLESEIFRLDFHPQYVDSHTRVCELAIKSNPLPSPYYLSAKQRHDELTAASQEDAQ